MNVDYTLEYIKPILDSVVEWFNGVRENTNIGDTQPINIFYVINNQLADKNTKPLKEWLYSNYDDTVNLVNQVYAIEYVLENTNTLPTSIDYLVNKLQVTDKMKLELEKLDEEGTIPRRYSIDEETQCNSIYKVFSVIRDNSEEYPNLYQFLFNQPSPSINGTNQVIFIAWFMDKVDIVRD